LTKEGDRHARRSSVEKCDESITLSEYSELVSRFQTLSLPDRAENGLKQWFFAMLLYVFRSRSGQYSGASDFGAELDRDEYRVERADLRPRRFNRRPLRQSLKEDSEWPMDHLDKSNNPLVRLRLMTQTLKQGRLN
jgi:hypothetical protein